MAITATLDKSNYNVGDLMTLKVTTAAGDRDVYTDEVHSFHAVVDGLTPADGSYTLHKKNATPAAVTVTDDLGKTWTKVSDTGTVATFTAPA